MPAPPNVFRPEPIVAPDSPVTPPRARPNPAGETNRDAYFPINGAQATGEGNVFPLAQGGIGVGGTDSAKGN